MTSTNLSQEDSAFVAHALQGDAAAFAGLIDRHAPRLKRLLRAMFGSRPEVDDLYQETILRAFLNLEQLRDPSRFGAWIYSIAVNLARTYRSTPSSEVVWENEPRSAQDRAPLSPEMQLLQEERLSRIHQAIADLPRAEREAIILVYLEDLSHQDAARELGASLSAVKVRVHRGRNHLRKLLMTEFGPQQGKIKKERLMLKVVVHDVVTTPPETVAPAAEEKEKKLFGRAGKLNVVLLREESGVCVLPIWIGPFEAESITIHLRQEKELKRPLTFDLMKTLLDLGQVQLARVDIHRLHEEVYYANLVVKTGDEEGEIDCRPSDALNLAVRLGVPVFVAPEIMEAQGRVPDEGGKYVIDLKQPDIEWKSLLAE